MAIQASAVWRIRAGGNNANGGGFDPSISGAGTDYTDQDSSQVVFSVGGGNALSAAQSSTTVTSAGTPFTSAMIGNAIQITGGTNFVTGFYFVTGYTSSSQITVDRAPATAGAGSAGTGRIGGAFSDLASVMQGSGGTPFTVRAPVAGNTIYIRGGGTDNPSSPDYTVTGYYDTMVAGTITEGLVKLIGYNGRPHIRGNGLLIYGAVNWHFEHLKFSPNGTASGTGMFDNCYRASFTDVYFDQNGQDFGFAATGRHFIGCLFDNTGSTTTGTYPTVLLWGQNAAGAVIGCRFRNQRFHGLRIALGGTVERNIFQNCGMRVAETLQVTAIVRHNVFYGAPSDGLLVDGADAEMMAYLVCHNNIFVNNGGYGLNPNIGTQALNDRLAWMLPDYNAYYNNTSGARHNLSAGPHDVTLAGNPFTDAANGDFSLNATYGATLKGVGYPQSLPG